MEFKEAIDRYHELDEQIKLLEKEKKECKEIIFENLEIGESATGAKFEVTLTPGANRFKCYSDEQKVVEFLKEANVVNECVSINRTQINKFIKDKVLPEEIKALEITKQDAPKLSFTQSNPWNMA